MSTAEWHPTAAGRVVLCTHCVASFPTKPSPSSDQVYRRCVASTPLAPTPAMYVHNMCGFQACRRKTPGHRLLASPALHTQTAVQYRNTRAARHILQLALASATGMLAVCGLQIALAHCSLLPQFPLLHRGRRGWWAWLAVQSAPSVSSWRASLPVTVADATVDSLDGQTAQTRKRIDRIVAACSWDRWPCTERPKYPGPPSTKASGLLVYRAADGSLVFDCEHPRRIGMRSATNLATFNILRRIAGLASTPSR